MSKSLAPPMLKNLFQVAGSLFVGGTLLLTGCSRQPAKTAPSADRSLVLALAVLGENDDGSPETLPGEIGIPSPGRWQMGSTEPCKNTNSNVFPQGDGLRLGRSVDPQRRHKRGKTLAHQWRADLLGKPISAASSAGCARAEVGSIYHDGQPAIAVTTHDHGVVAVLRRDGAGTFKLQELDRQPETVVHEIEIGDLDGDGILEIYAHPDRTEPGRWHTQPARWCATCRPKGRPDRGGRSR